MGADVVSRMLGGRWLGELLYVLYNVRCPEYVWPEMRFPSCRCTKPRWHEGAHENKSGDVWKGERR